MLSSKVSFEKIPLALSYFSFSPIPDWVKVFPTDPLNPSAISDGMFPIVSANFKIIPDAPIAVLPSGVFIKAICSLRVLAAIAPSATSLKLST